MIKKQFSLLNDPWIPVVDVGRVSLRQLFSEPAYRALGGNPVQKIALTKLLLAIAQAAYTPQDDDDWAALGAQGLAEKSLAYLEKWQDHFYLYGDQPFLQMPEITKAAEQSLGAVLPEIATGNTTVVNAFQLEKNLDDADKALLILTLMGFALAGKKTDNTVVLSETYTGKTKPNGKGMSGKAGTSIGFMGFLHNFLSGESILQSLWFNLLSHEDIKTIGLYPQGLGAAPWEVMPQTEDCTTALQLQESVMGRLVPLSRFCLLTENGLHYSEGIAHPDYKSGVVDPSVAVNFKPKTPKIIWADTERRPWRSLTALLSFMEANGEFNCYTLQMGLLRTRKQTAVENIGIWSGGLRVSSNAGEQYASGSDDFVESSVFIPAEELGENWYQQLKLEMKEIEKLAKTIYGASRQYFADLGIHDAKQAGFASNLFWQLCERQFQTLLYACEDSEQTKRLRKTFAAFASKAYNDYCPKETARQLEAWAKNHPNLSKYMKDTAKPKEIQI
ncbi:type I-E CRISPR-associated protein Cse1/CasA [Candidatus Venteria ishoeyi]|uniref:type I-E CRISPR-associated protein Cse1/CasA n=1 Tax=Candidatus Venteria ishoeyi TaxID=1899563 RepID=UPI0025A58AB8|nr:type I-E CRISPR-associated protein Cse1/CasA [Candidatus Venteria ishoeyi]MDM8545410.1 type I-E CRISPR-associated protein Cse1/CasA [Candidatus Venteria ishoeyi]